MARSSIGKAAYSSYQLDGARLRIAGIPTYGVSGLFDDIDDVRAHGKDERMGVQHFFDGLEFMYRLVKALSSSK